MFVSLQPQMRHKCAWLEAHTPEATGQLIIITTGPVHHKIVFFFLVLLPLATNLQMFFSFQLWGSAILITIQLCSEHATLSGTLTVDLIFSVEHFAVWASCRSTVWRSK